MIPPTVRRPPRAGLLATALLPAALLLSSCSTGTPALGAAMSPDPGPTVSAASADPAAPLPAPATFTFTPRPALADDRSGSALDQPFSVNGIVVVSKDHPVSRAYVPAWASAPNGLHPDAAAGLQRLIAGAKKDGLTLKLRSGYRDYTTQAASFRRALGQYDEATARRYFAEAGKSEHQTGLAADVWDGRNRGTAFARTPQATWLAEHAWEYGFIVRYPQGKTDITGYAWESWHLRWVGPEVAQAFGPNSTLTLEEYLGLA